MTTVFYAPPEAFSSGHVELPDDEARHAVKVLRHRAGDEIVVVDGVGRRHSVVLETVERGRVTGEVVATEAGVGEPSFELTVGLGIVRNAGRFETFVEKAVELGVSRIVPLVTERTEQSRIRENRLTGIMVAAMKQSGRCRLPTLDEPTALSDALTAIEAPLRFVCHEGSTSRVSLPAALDASTARGGAAVLIGPEGGFSEREVEDARSAAWGTVSLGPRRLRAETAAILAVGTIMLHAEG